MQSTLFLKGVCDQIDKANKRFIWAGTAASSKIPLIRWDIVTHNKEEGELGIKGAYEMNIFLLAKLG